MHFLVVSASLMSIWALTASSLPTPDKESPGQVTLPDDVQHRVSAFLQSLREDELAADGSRASVSFDRGDHVLVFFECGPGQAQCVNGGYGPAVSYRPKLHPICTCLCPASFNSPRCQFPSEEIEIVTS